MAAPGSMASPPSSGRSPPSSGTSSPPSAGIADPSLSAAALIGIEREGLLRVADAAQRIAADRDQARAGIAERHGKRRGAQHGLIDRAAHRRDPAGLVDRRPDDREVETLGA